MIKSNLPYFLFKLSADFLLKKLLIVFIPFLFAISQGFFAGSIPINYKGSKNSIFSYNYQSIPGNSLGRGQIGVQISHVF